MSSEQEMSDAQFTNVFSIMIGGLIVLTIALIILAIFIGSDVQQSDINATVRDTSVAERIEPAGDINIGEAGTAGTGGDGGATGAGATEVASGEEVYNSSCAACHASGVAGAPVLGDEAAWTDRVAKGQETLYTHAIEGFQGSAGVMPPKGGNASLSDEEVKAAVDHMLAAVQSEAQSTSASAGSGETASDTETDSETGGEAAGTAAGEAGSADGGETDAAGAEASSSETTASAEAATDAAAGEEVYNSSCVACHAAGVAGAPKLGDTEAWSDRIAKGEETLYTHAIEGFQGSAGVMPPKGGNMSLSDAEVKAAVDYMVDAVE